MMDLLSRVYSLNWVSTNRGEVHLQRVRQIQLRQQRRKIHRHADEVGHRTVTVRLDRSAPRVSPTQGAYPTFEGKAMAAMKSGTRLELVGSIPGRRCAF